MILARYADKHTSSAVACATHDTVSSVEHEMTEPGIVLERVPACGGRCIVLEPRFGPLDTVFEAGISKLQAHLITQPHSIRFVSDPFVVHNRYTDRLGNVRHAHTHETLV